MCNNDRVMEIFGKVRKVLDKRGYHYMAYDDRGMFQYLMRVDSKIASVAFHIKVSENAVLVCAEASVKAPFKDKKLMREVCEMICRINYGFRMGSFDLDVSDGQLMFRCCLDCEDVIPSEGMIENAIICPCMMYGRYGDAIADVFFGAATAKDAVARAESSMNEIGGDDDDDDDDWNNGGDDDDDEDSGD